MKYLIKYSAYTDHGNGCCVCDFEKIEENFEDLCREIALLEDNHKDDDDFSYTMYELHKCDKKLVTENQIYLNLKKEFEQEYQRRILREQIGLKRNEISNIELTKNKYGKWEKYDEQLDSMKKELNTLENKLTTELEK